MFGTVSLENAELQLLPSSVLGFSCKKAYHRGLAVWPITVILWLGMWTLLLNGHNLAVEVCCY